MKKKKKENKLGQQGEKMFSNYIWEYLLYSAANIHFFYTIKSMMISALLPRVLHIQLHAPIAQIFNVIKEF